MTKTEVIQIACNAASVGLFIAGNMNIPHTTPQVIMLALAGVFQVIYQGCVRAEKKHQNEQNDTPSDRIEWVSKGLKIYD